MTTEDAPVTAQKLRTAAGILASCGFINPTGRIVRCINDAADQLEQQQARIAALEAQCDALAAQWSEIGQWIDKAAIGYNHHQITSVFLENRTLRAQVAALEADACSLQSLVDAAATTEAFLFGLHARPIGPTIAVAKWLTNQIATLTAERDEAVRHASQFLMPTVDFENRVIVALRLALTKAEAERDEARRQIAAVWVLEARQFYVRPAILVDDEQPGWSSPMLSQREVLALLDAPTPPVKPSPDAELVSQPLMRLDGDDLRHVEDPLPLSLWERQQANYAEFVRLARAVVKEWEYQSPHKQIALREEVEVLRAYLDTLPQEPK